MTHVLTGQYDSPFVRRAALALGHHGVTFRREVLSVFGDFMSMLGVNPLGKVPVLTLPDGRILPDSRAIIEWVEAAAPPERRLMPQTGTFDVLAIEAVAIGLAEKTYERGIETARRRTSDPAWTARVEAQVTSALGWLACRTAAEGPGERLTRADLALTVALTYLAEKQPALYARAAPRLQKYRAAAEARDLFAAHPYRADEATASGWRLPTG